MHKAIHPELIPTEVVCTTCGTSFETRSTVPELHVDVCSRCHPAYTGGRDQRASGSQVERFTKRWGRSLARA